MITFYIFLSVTIVSLVSLVGVFTLSFREDFLRKMLFVFVGLAAGALFGDALIHLIPEALETSSNPVFVSLAVLLGILLFFVLEKFLYWHHSHDLLECSGHCDAHEKNNIKPLGYLVLTSDTVHNFVDGLIIAASFLISVEVGIATTLAVLLHEIPQEIADFSLLLHSGFSKSKALLLNFMTAFSSVLGALTVVLVGSLSESVTPLLAAFAAGVFLYIAGSDLVPEIHKTRDIKKSAIQFFSIIVGILIMLALAVFEI